MKNLLLPIILGTFGSVCLIMLAEATAMVVDDDGIGTDDIAGLSNVEDGKGTDGRLKITNDNLINDAIQQAIEDFEGKISKLASYGYSKNDKG